MSEVDLIPAITREGMVEIDRIMVHDLRVSIPLMMENAGLNLARLTANIMRDLNKQKVLVIAGSGNNGGGGLAAARRLSAWGVDVSISIPKGKPKREIPMMQYTMLKNMDVKELNIHNIDDLDDYLFIDAFIGYNFTGGINDETQLVFDMMRNNATISLDIPSGMDSNTGKNVANINPHATLTLAWAKTGILDTDPQAVGQLFLADIGVPGHAFLNPSMSRAGEEISTTHIELVQKSFKSHSPQPITAVDGRWNFVNIAL